MRVALIDPSFWHEGNLLKLRRIGYFPLTLPRLASFFPPDVSVKLFFEKCQEIDTSVTYDLVMFTTMGSSIVRAEELSREFRSRGVKTMVGGYSVKPYLDRCLENFDSLVVGDAEGIIGKILLDLKENRLERVYENLGPSIDDLPIPRFDLVDDGIIGDILPVEATRGCPNCCTFCAVSSQYHSGFRKRKPDQILRDIKSIRTDLKKRMIFFTDPNFSADLSFAKEIMREMREIGIYWLASVDVRALKDVEFLSLARDSGCFCLQVGFETLSKNELDGTGKGFAGREKYSELIKSSQEFGIPLAALLMIGFDSDDSRSLMETAKFLEAHHLPLVVMHPMIPIPTTSFYETLKTQNRLLSQDPKLADGLHVFFRPKNFSPEGLQNYYWKLNERLYSIRSILKRFFFRGVFKNPIPYFILFLTNFFARRLVKNRLPMGMYE